MALIDYVLGQRRQKTAKVAKERLQILLAHEHYENRTLAYLPEMREEILRVIAKYVEIDDKNLQISIDEADGVEILELNLVLPDEKK